MAKIEFGTRANNSPAENILTPIILLLGIVFAVFGIKLKWFRHRLTFNSSETNTPISNSENTNQVFGVYKRNEIDDRDFRARIPNEPGPTYTANANHHGEGSASLYKTVKVNNEIKIIPPAPSYIPPTIHQGNIKTTEIRVDFNNNNNNGYDRKSPVKEQKAPKYIQIKKDDYKKTATAKSKAPSPQPNEVPIAVQHVTPTVHKPKAAAPVLLPPPPVIVAPPPQIQPAPPVVKQELKIAVPGGNLIPPPQIQQPVPPRVKQESRNPTPAMVPVSFAQIDNPPPPPYTPPFVIEVENPAITAKLNSMPTTYIQLNDFDSTESDDIQPPPTIRSVQFHDEYESSDDAQFAYNDPIPIKQSAYNNNMGYNDKIEIVMADGNDDLFQKMKPTPRTTGINYLEYQSNHKKLDNNNNETDDNSESKFDDGYELAPLEFLSKATTPTTTTTRATNNAVTTKNDEMVHNHAKAIPTTTSTTANTNNKKDERNKIVVSDSDDDDNDDDDDADNDNMWDLVAKHRKSVGRNVEWDRSVNVNSKINKNQRAIMSSIAATDKPKTLRELHSQNRENSRKIQQAMPPKAKATSKSNDVTFGELEDEADA